MLTRYPLKHSFFTTEQEKLTGSSPSGDDFTICGTTDTDERPRNSYFCSENQNGYTFSD